VVATACTRPRGNPLHCQRNAAIEAAYAEVGPQIRDAKSMGWLGDDGSEDSYYFPRVNRLPSGDHFGKRVMMVGCISLQNTPRMPVTGYREGALSSDYPLARRLAVRDKIPDA
jgi:hypothetical protein